MPISLFQHAVFSKMFQSQILDGLNMCIFPDIAQKWGHFTNFLALQKAQPPPRKICGEITAPSALAKGAKAFFKSDFLGWFL